MLKNNDRSPVQPIVLNDGLWLLPFPNDTETEQRFEKQLSSQFIQFHFCVKGRGELVFNEGRYTLDLRAERSLLLYNPQRALPIDLRVAPDAWVVSLWVSINRLHALFSEDTSHLDFLQAESRNQRYYHEVGFSPAMAVVLNQLLNVNLDSAVRRAYQKGKAYELLALYFNRPNQPNVDQCPFLTDAEDLRKIRAAKEIILDNLAEPPGLQQLAEQIGLSLKKLKEGFKEVYGDTVYGFLLDHKMEYARKLLASGSYNVNEVALKTGYSTASHFITAFKKKFGTTPKKYLAGVTP